MKGRVDELIIKALQRGEMVPTSMSSRRVQFQEVVKVEKRKFKYLLINGVDFNDLVISIMRTSNDPKELKDIEQMKYKGYRVISSYDIEEGRLELI